MPDTTLGSALCDFGAALTRNFGAAQANPAQPEDQLKAPVQELLERAGTAFGVAVARTEALSGDGVRPDIGITLDGYSPDTWS